MPFNDDAKLDGAFVELSLRGFKQVMADLRVFRDQLDGVREHMDDLRLAGERNGFAGFREGAERTAWTVRQFRGDVEGLNAALNRLPSRIGVTFAADAAGLRHSLNQVPRAVPVGADVSGFRQALSRLSIAPQIAVPRAITPRTIAPPLPTAERVYDARRLDAPQLVKGRLQNAQRVVPVRVTNFGHLAGLLRGFGGGPPTVYPIQKPPRPKGAGGPKENPFGAAGTAVARVNQAAFTAASAGIMGFVRAGLQGSIQGEMLAQRFQLVSREIAGIFLPIVNRLTAALDRLAAHMATLDSAGQAQLRSWALQGLAVTGFVGVAPRAISALSGIATTATQMAMSLGMSAAAAGPVGIALAALAAMGAIVAGKFAILFATSDKFRTNVATITTVVGAFAGRLWEIFSGLPKAVQFLISPFAFILANLETFVDFAARAATVFTTVWQVATGRVSAMFDELAARISALADLIPATRRNSRGWPAGSRPPPSGWPPRPGPHT